MISFSTIDRTEAALRLANPKFNYLTQAAKDFVLDNLVRLDQAGEQTGSGCRVQCVVMYPSPQIEFHGPDAESLYREVLKRIEVKDETADSMVETQKKSWEHT